MSLLTNALLYVRNTDGNATKDDFVDDHTPVGEQLWKEMTETKLVTINAQKKIILTTLGRIAIGSK